MSEKRLTGEIVLRPYDGATLRDVELALKSTCGLYAASNTIAEVERPSKDAVALARMVEEEHDRQLRDGGHSNGTIVGCSWAMCIAASAILRAEAAFAEPKCAVCNDAGFCNACNPCKTDPAPPRPVDGSDAVKLANKMRFNHTTFHDGDLDDCENVGCICARDILKRSETK